MTHSTQKDTLLHRRTKQQHLATVCKSLPQLRTPSPCSLGSKRTRGILDLRGVRDLAFNDKTLEDEDEVEGNATAGGVGADTVGDTEIDKGAKESKGIAALPR